MLWFGIYNVDVNEGERWVDAGTAAMLIQIAPILIAILAAIFLGEKMTWHLGTGLVLAFGGVCPIGFAASGDGSSDLLGVALCVLAAAAYAVSLSCRSARTMGYADQRAVLGPGTVVVLGALVSEQLAQHEPRASSAR